MMMLSSSGGDLISHGECQNIHSGLLSYMLGSESGSLEDNALAGATDDYDRSMDDYDEQAAATTMVAKAVFSMLASSPHRYLPSMTSLPSSSPAKAAREGRAITPRRHLFEDTCTSPSLSEDMPMEEDLGFLPPADHETLANPMDILPSSSSLAASPLRAAFSAMANAHETPSFGLLAMHGSQPRHWNRRAVSAAKQPDGTLALSSTMMRRTVSECAALKDFLSSPKIPLPSRLGFPNDSLPTTNGESCQLPCYPSPHDALKRISLETMSQLLHGHYDGCFDRIEIIDCRYPYEFHGGHLPHAINMNTVDCADRQLLASPLTADGSRVALVFHCEFSSERAPRLALHVRNMDRMLNGSAYPRLHYPEIYILDGGYRAFVSSYPQQCVPVGGYTPMRKAEHREELKQWQSKRRIGRERVLGGGAKHAKIVAAPRPIKRAYSMGVDPTKAFYQFLEGFELSPDDAPEENAMDEEIAAPMKMICLSSELGN